MNGSAYIPMNVRVQAPCGPDVEISFQTLKKMAAKLHNLQDICIRGYGVRCWC